MGSMISYLFSNANYRYEQMKKLKFFDNKTLIKLDRSFDVLFPHYMALTDDGRVYSWGWNGCGQLGNATKIRCDTPKIINSLSEEFIIDICCGERHSLVLTRNGEVFAFGNNLDGQCGNDSKRYQLTPFKINISSKVTSISCGNWHSIALTGNCDVFGWGENSDGQLGIEITESQFIPIQINVTKVKQILCGKKYSLMLSIDGHIYVCGEINNYLSHKIPTQLISNIKFIKISEIKPSNLCVALSEDNKCFIFGNYFVNWEQINIKNLTETEFTTIKETSNFYEQLLNNTYQYNYKRDFIEISPLGSGGFGSVFKSKYKIDWKIYAIKKISFEPEKSESVLKEIQFLSQLKSEFIVKYYNSWIESNYYLDQNSGENNQNINVNNLSLSDNKSQLLHIQMEICSMTLRDAINIIIKECKTPDNTLSLIGYYISSELLYEILECVYYLHSQEKPIIHRDLKPENILLTNFVNNRFVKLSDFGLSTFHEFIGQSHTEAKGTPFYKAPELITSRNYSTKADIYSLGIVLKELFCIDINNSNMIYLPVLKPYMNYLLKLLEKLLSPIPDKRPNCDQLLSDNHLWRLSDKQILEDKQFNQVLSKSLIPQLIEENFVEYFVHKKYEIKQIKPKRESNATFSKILSAIMGNK